MSVDLGFSDRILGFGAGIFFVGYVLFEIPGAVIVERWSARKWMARIMISWGVVTVLTEFIQTAPSLTWVGSLALTLSAGSMTGQAACQPHFCSSLFATSWPAGFSLRSGFRHRSILPLRI